MDEPTERILPWISTLPLVGRVLHSRYELFEEIGSGEMAHVFRAWDRQIQHIVAVKVLDRRFATNAEIAERFEREARLVASLPTHQNIVTVHDVGRDEGLPYVVMQLRQGGSLSELIRTEAPLNAVRAFTICHRAAQGLEFAHQYGLLHGNIKPQNILVSGADEVALTDFGVGLVGEMAAARTNGLPRRSQYLAPEQLLDSPPDARSDVYSLGLVLFEMLTGTLPFQSVSTVAAAVNGVHEKTEDPSQLNPTVSASAAAVVLRAIKQQPADRYKSAAAFAAALNQVLALEGGETPRHSHPLAATQPVPTGGAAASAREHTGAKPIQTPRMMPRPRDFKSRGVSLMSLLFLVTVAIAAGGGWYAYGAVDRWLNGSSSGSGTAHHSLTPPRRRVTRHVAPSRARTRPTHVGATFVGGCATHYNGPVRLLRMWAEAVSTNPGGSITFEYTIANDGPQCRDVRLGLTAYSDVAPNLIISDPRDAQVVGALPGTHLYRRRFVFPPSTAGQRFDVLLTVSDPSGAHPYGAIRVNRLIAVAAR